MKRRKRPESLGCFCLPAWLSGKEGWHPHKARSSGISKDIPLVLNTINSQVRTWRTQEPAITTSAAKFINFLNSGGPCKHGASPSAMWPHPQPSSHLHSSVRNSRAGLGSEATSSLLRATPEDKGQSWPLYHPALCEGAWTWVLNTEHKQKKDLYLRVAHTWWRIMQWPLGKTCRKN